MATYTYEYYTRLVRKIISTNKPVSNNIMNRYLDIESTKTYALPIILLDQTDVQLRIDVDQM